MKSIGQACFDTNLVKMVIKEKEAEKQKSKKMKKEKKKKETESKHAIALQPNQKKMKNKTAGYLSNDSVLGKLNAGKGAFKYYVIFFGPF